MAGSIDGKIVPHWHLAVPAGAVSTGKIVPHSAVQALAAGAEPAPAEPDLIGELVDRLNGVLEAAGLGRPVLGAEEFLATIAVDDDADEVLVLRALRRDGVDEDLQKAQLWSPAAPGHDPSTGLETADSPGTLGAPGADSRTVPH
jgi:hypothetical protein